MGEPQQKIPMKQNYSKEKVPFTQVANCVLNDSRLSWKAKGIFSYLYSKPDDWDFSAMRIQDDSSDGYKPLISGIKELEEFGYLTRKKSPDGKTHYFISYNPSIQKAYLPKRQVAKTDTITNIEDTTNIEEKKKERKSFFRKSDKERWEGVQTGTDYVPDGYPPHVKLAEKKKMEKALGLAPAPPKVKFMFSSGGKFLENYERLFGIPWEGKGILQLDPVAKTLSEWYDRGMREDGAAALVLQYFKSKKAREGTITPTACFSEHTWQAYRQNKLK